MSSPIETLPIEGLFLVKPRIFEDDRGLFLESFREEWFAEQGKIPKFVQDNLSQSKKGVVRGLHYQLPPFAQGKLITVSYGSIIDVAVDLRKHSQTFGQHVAVELNDQNRQMLWIPPGFAHGFSALEDNTVVQYKCTAYYHKESERGIRVDDPLLGIEWGVDTPILSEKDLQNPSFNDIPENDLF